MIMSQKKQAILNVFPSTACFRIGLTVRWMTGMLWPPSGDISCKWPPTSTNLTAFIEHCLNCMSFSVRVPVLSVNRYSTYQETERVHVGTSVLNIIPKIHRVPQKVISFDDQLQLI